MAKTKKSKKTATAPKKDLWSISGLEKRARELIQSGLLLSGGLDALVQALSEEFAEKLEADKVRVTKIALSRHMRELIWTKQVDRDLWRAHGNSMVSKFREAYGYIPEKEVNKHIRELKGGDLDRLANAAKSGHGSPEHR